MKNILILDTETTALSPRHGSLIEVAGIYFNIESNSIIQQVSTLLRAEKNEAEHINNITVSSLLATQEDLIYLSFKLLEKMMIDCDGIVAHNASFDRNWIENASSLSALSKNKIWFCSKNDIHWKASPSLKLVDIAQAMGVPVISAHRALSDCQMLAACFQKLNNLPQQLALLNTDSFKVYEALVSYEQRELPKKAGFNWNHDKKKWQKKLTPEQAELVDFPITLAG